MMSDMPIVVGIAYYAPMGVQHVMVVHSAYHAMLIITGMVQVAAYSVLCLVIAAILHSVCHV